LKAIKSDDAIIIAQFIIKAEIPDANVKRYATATGSGVFAAEFVDRLDSRFACQFRGDLNSRCSSHHPSQLRFVSVLMIIRLNKEATRVSLKEICPNSCNRA